MTPRARRVAGIVAFAAFLAVWIVVLRPQAIGGPALYIVVRGSSMLPTYENGDLVVVQAAPLYDVGDVVAYRVPDGEIGEGHVIVHRLTGADEGSGFLVTGDNNNAPDPWRPKAIDIAGKAWVSVHGVGRLVAFIHQPVVAGALGAALAVSIVLLRVPGVSEAPKPQRRVWRRPPRRRRALT
ncbi:MAG TPA: signal peptidase I [Candidatus Limnocylindrales bacterium]|nr:signal peptidase I [Candidatus Limnocylindrales bacterium]